MLPSLSVYHPRQMAYSTVQYRELPDSPDDQVASTIGVMAAYARDDATTPQIQQAAKEAMAEAAAGGEAGDPLAAVWSYVRNRMTFVRDDAWSANQTIETHTGLPVIEVVTRPRDVLTWGAGDCDCYSTFAASLLLALGVPVRFATIAADPQAPTEYSHVYLVAYPQDQARRRVPMDLSHGKYIGWETENKFGKLTEWPVDGGAESFRFAGIAACAFGVWCAWNRLRGFVGGLR
jgi:transglutaminase-like putative cysteine protease